MPLARVRQRLVRIGPGAVSQPRYEDVDVEPFGLFPDTCQVRLQLSGKLRREVLGFATGDPLCQGLQAGGGKAFRVLPRDAGALGHRDSRRPICGHTSPDHAKLWHGSATEAHPRRTQPNA
jgi:hypothetical protein